MSGNRELNLKRHELLRPGLNAQFSALCNASTPISTELFGDDVRKEIAEVSGANRLGKKLASHEKGLVSCHQPYGPRRRSIGLWADTTNVNRIANSLMEKLGQCNEMFAKLQEMTNKHVEKYTVLYPEYCNLRPRERGNKISNRTHKQRCKNTHSRRNKAQLEANTKHIKNL